MLTITAILSIALAQSPAGAPAAAPAQAPAGQTFSAASSQVENQLAAALNELSVLRERVATEKVPLTRRIGELENQLIDARQKLQQVQRVADSRALDLTNLSNEIKGRRGGGGEGGGVGGWQKTLLKIDEELQLPTTIC